METDLLIVGAGPAGIAAATAAAQHGRSVTLIDDNPAPGGQIWRSGLPDARVGEDRFRIQALERLERSGAELWMGHRVVHVPFDHHLDLLDETGPEPKPVRVRYRDLILATGARERFLPFPGWTLPGVFGAGGLQALVKSGYPVEGRRIVVAGTGPLLLAVAAHLREYGAEIACVVEQAPMNRLMRFGASLWSSPGKLLQGMEYRRAMRASFRTGCWLLEALPAANGAGLRGVRLTDGRRVWEERCNLLAAGFHLVPNTELAELLGCRMDGGFAAVDEMQQTSVPHVFCAGEPTGIAGLEAALVQGEAAGLACAGQPIAHLASRVRAGRRFAERLASTFALRPELLSVARPETLVCRCEDVPLARVAAFHGWTEAKLQTRCGMGPCQGRICGPAVEALLGWHPVSVRPPLAPVPLGAFVSHSEEPLRNEEHR